MLPKTATILIHNSRSGLGLFLMWWAAWTFLDQTLIRFHPISEAVLCLLGAYLMVIAGRYQSNDHVLASQELKAMNGDTEHSIE